jgi:hypothetical protein
VTGGSVPRNALLVALYEAADGAMLQMVDSNAVGDELGLDKVTRDAAMIYLHKAGYIGDAVFGGEVSLSVLGIQEAERLKAQQPAVALFLTWAERAAVEELVTFLERSEVADRLPDAEAEEYVAVRNLLNIEVRKDAVERSLTTRLVGRLVDFGIQAGAMVTAELGLKLAGL